MEKSIVQLINEGPNFSDGTTKLNLNGAVILNGTISGASEIDVKENNVGAIVTKLGESLVVQTAESTYIQAQSIKLNDEIVI